MHTALMALTVEINVNRHINVKQLLNLLYCQAEMIQSALTVLAGLQLGSDLPVLNEVPAHDRDAPALFSAVCSYTRAISNNNCCMNPDSFLT